MTTGHTNNCDETLLYRYLDGVLPPDEQRRLVDHLDSCRSCRRQVASMADFSQGLRDRVRQATETVDFTALEKDVLNKALHQYRQQGQGSAFITFLKYTIPATVAAGLLVFFGYSHFLAQPAQAPSAIINSFTGSMSSVMIFETPETRQTILWYKEDADVESEHNAV
jgi:predicted anti-sigma-YlaC factor YlaD